MKIIKNMVSTMIILTGLPFFIVGILAEHTLGCFKGGFRFGQAITVWFQKG